jgi:hypothetical protein
MNEDQTHISQRPLRTPRAAATAGIIFAILQITAIVLLQIAIPPDSISTSDWLTTQSGKITLALGMLPFSGIAFLWFMGVVRDRLGHLEDQFFSTLFFGSGLLYLAMTFATAAIAGGLITVYAFDPELIFNGGFYLFGQAMIFKFNNVYAIRMAGMFITSVATIWVRTGLMPRWLTILTYLTALILLVGISFIAWTTLAFPIWVFLISAYILVLNYRYTQKQDGVTLEK